MKLSRKIRNTRGFTLMELMVVILIIAVLASLVVPRLLGAQDEAKVAATRADISTASNALQRFRLDCDRFPTAEEGLGALSMPPSDVENWKGPYLEKEIINDKWNTPLEYVWPGNGGDDTFIIRSSGKNKQPNDDDDITNMDL